MKTAGDIGMKNWATHACGFAPCVGLLLFLPYVLILSPCFIFLDNGILASLGDMDGFLGYGVEGG